MVDCGISFLIFYNEIYNSEIYNTITVCKYSL